MRILGRAIMAGAGATIGVLVVLGAAGWWTVRDGYHPELARLADWARRIDTPSDPYTARVDMEDDRP